MTVVDLKKEYNKLLKRYNKACEWFDDKTISNQEKEQHLPLFKQVLTGLNYYLEKIEVYTSQEILEGFDEK